MPRIRIAIAGIALGSAALFQSAHAQRLPSREPPAEWAEYIAQAKAADAIKDDEARCKAYPDLPGNQWRPGAAQGRCALLRQPAWTLDQIDALLANRKGVTQLERDFATLLDAHYRDRSQREQIFIAFSVFDASPRAGEVAQRWLKAAPQSAFANAAAGMHYGTAGWKARGTRYASKTSEDQFKEMSRYFAQAVPAYLRAMELEPRLSVACAKLTAIGRQSDAAMQAYASSRCREVDPDSYYVAWEQIVSAQPKWGGSDDALRGAVAYAAARTERNPILGALLAEAAGYRPGMAENEGEVVEELVEAARLGPSVSLLADAGRGYWVNDDWWRGIAYYSQALRFRPDDAWYRYARAALTAPFYHLQWAHSDMVVALKQEPGNARYLVMMGGIIEGLESPAAARPYYQRAMTGEYRMQALERYCSTFLFPDVAAEADACTRELVEALPASASAWRLRSRALVGHDIEGAAAAAKRAEALDPPRPGPMIEIVQPRRPANGASGK
ncbi:tetratricopeptide (TPR) repeat protein [Lysobacter sp. OAE881]|uniref:DUF4034 domain-containing protein n=1 Tax=Lysobacter sp. OAE881 TaxID=2663813 RepID=UPI00178B7763